MPGTRKDYQRVLDDLKAGKISRPQLEVNASRVVRMIDTLS